MQQLNHVMKVKTIQDFINLYEDKELSLSPGFQRQSVWSTRDRSKLIDSIIRNYPIPAIFLYKRLHDGNIIYDVIDGKQRLESIFMFTGDIPGKYDAKIQLPGEDEKKFVSYKYLKTKQKQNLITGYSICSIEVDGDLSDVIDLFVRINSTGKALSSSEKRHARYHKSHFLKEASKLASKYQKYFIKQKVLSSGQITRMKHVELIAELMISIKDGDVINKKTAIDKVMGNDSDLGFMKNAKKKTIKALNRVRHMFPNLYTVRFHQLSDFYSLVVLISKFEDEGKILTNKKRNKKAWELLKTFSNGVDEVRLLQKKAKGIKPGQESYRDYLLTVESSTDEITKRKNRENILRGILGSLFEQKDSQRLFSIEQKRMLWNSDVERKCIKCNKPIKWSDLSIDHIKPHSKSGKSILKNAALMHKKCNASKGNR